jgi:HIT domain
MKTPARVQAPENGLSPIQPGKSVFSGSLGDHLRLVNMLTVSSILASARKTREHPMYHSSEKNCRFCKKGRHELDHASVLEDEDVLAIMALFPATPGHVLVLPKRHIETPMRKAYGRGIPHHDNHNGGKGDEGEAVS